MNQMRKTIFKFLILFLSDLYFYFFVYFISRICTFSTQLFGDQKYIFLDYSYDVGFANLYYLLLYRYKQGFS